MEREHGQQDFCCGDIITIAGSKPQPFRVVSVDRPTKMLQVYQPHQKALATLNLHNTQVVRVYPCWRAVQQDPSKHEFASAPPHSTVIHGVGIVATLPIPPFTVILREKPLVPNLTSMFTDLTPCDIAEVEKLHALSDNPDLTKALTQRFGKGLKTAGMREDKVKLLSRIYAANSFESGLYVTGSRFNHSCSPNVVYDFDFLANEMIFMTCEAIRPGAELCVSYVREFAPSAERHHKLRVGKEFVCRCPAVCAQETSPFQKGIPAQQNPQQGRDSLLMELSNLRDRLKELQTDFGAYRVKVGLASMSEQQILVIVAISRSLLNRALRILRCSVADLADVVELTYLVNPGSAKLQKEKTSTIDRDMMFPFLCVWEFHFFYYAFGIVAQCSESKHARALKLKEHAQQLAMSATLTLQKVVPTSDSAEMKEDFPVWARDPSGWCQRYTQEKFFHVSPLQFSRRFPIS